MGAGAGDNAANCCSVTSSTATGWGGDTISGLSGDTHSSAAANPAWIMSEASVPQLGRRSLLIAGRAKASLTLASLPVFAAHLRSHALAILPRLVHADRMHPDMLLLALSTFFRDPGAGGPDPGLCGADRAQYPRPSGSNLRCAAALIATGILLFFAVFGQALLALFGITLPALRIAGGVLLLLISIDMVFARHSGGTGTTPEEEKEARTRPDISVFPLATPLIAGPGAISATILLASPAGLFSLSWVEVVIALLLILILCYLAMLVAIPIQRLLGITGLAVVSRVVGVLLAALSMQFLIDGIQFFRAPGGRLTKRWANG